MEESKLSLTDGVVLEFSNEQQQQLPQQPQQQPENNDKNRLAEFRQRLCVLIHHHYFQICTIILVLLDTAVVVTEILVASASHGEPNEDTKKAGHILHYLSLSILSFFMIEVSAKIFAMGRSFFTHKFEIFDAVVVTLSFFLDIFLSSGGLKDGIEFLILLRLWRITRVVNGIIVSVKTRAAETKDRLTKQIYEYHDEVQKLQLSVESQKFEIKYLRSCLTKAGVTYRTFDDHPQ